MKEMPEGWKIESYKGIVGVCHDADWYLSPRGDACCSQCHPAPWVEFPEWSSPRREGYALTSISPMWAGVAHMPKEDVGA